MDIFTQLESNVRSYCRAFPTVFTRASGSTLTDVKGRRYLDFLSGAGTLNYGHNNPILKKRLLDYIESNGIVHGLDMATAAKQQFLETFERLILRPRNLAYKMQFTGPTGANAVEAALKLVRNLTGRSNVIAFTRAFHGVTLGALSATANAHFRGAGGLPAACTDFMPYDGYLGPGVDTTEYLDRVLRDDGSGIDHPAAVIVETVQGEGGINVASFEWLRSLEDVCRRHQILLIVDDIQVGCGRTGPFFSFEEAGIRPDIITLSKSLSGYGLPFSLVLIKPDLDEWQPGEHNGTFRGHNLAFVTATAALDEYWQDDELARDVARKGCLLRTGLDDIVEDSAPGRFSARGRGMVQGIDCGDGDVAARISTRAFEHGLLIERSGPDNQVLKCLSPLTISDDELMEGLQILDASIQATLQEAGQKAAVGAVK